MESSEDWDPERKVTQEKPDGQVGPEKHREGRALFGHLVWPETLWIACLAPTHGPHRGLMSSDLPQSSPIETAPPAPALHPEG